MNPSSDAAESVVRLSLQGTEVALKVTGSGAKVVAATLYALMKDKKKVKGKTKLENMLKSGKPLKVFSIKKEDLEQFTKVAKQYGVLYSLIMKKDSKDGMVDIMAFAEDASKINRIVERFKMATVDTASIRSEVQKSKDSKAENDKGVETKSSEDKIVDDILSKPIQKEENTEVNPDLAKTEKSPLSEPSLKNKNNLGVVSKNMRPSVRKTLQKIKNELKMRNLTEQQKEDLKEGMNVVKLDLTKNKMENYRMNKKGNLSVKKYKFKKSGKERGE